MIDLDAEPEQGRGFVFREASPAALLDAVTRASAFFARPAALATARRRVMALDFSWERSAGDYLLLYAAARSARRGAEAEVAQRLAAIEVNQARDSRPRPGQDP
ncbi:hypothetical protein FJ251_09505 [bacterium]|nr:hypothetical protein [bacterium]